MIIKFPLKLDLQFFAQDPPPADPLKPKDPDPKTKDDPLDQTERQELIKLRKVAAITAAGITDPEDIESMKTHVDDLEDPAEIKQKIDEILFQLKLGKFQQSGDPNPGNGFRQDPQPVSHEKQGRQLYHSIKKRK